MRRRWPDSRCQLYPIGYWCTFCAGACRRPLLITPLLRVPLRPLRNSPLFIGSARHGAGPDGRGDWCHAVAAAANRRGAGRFCARTGRTELSSAASFPSTLLALIDRAIMACLAGQMLQSFFTGWWYWSALLVFSWSVIQESTGAGTTARRN